LAITQTRDGYLWLGTLGGLARFDGLQFTVFNEGNTPGLKSRRVVSLFEDQQGRLWIGTETEGVVFLKDGQIRRFDLGRGARSRLASICEDDTGNVWLLTADGQLCRYQNDRADVWDLKDGFNNCRALAAEKGGFVWVGSDTNLIALRTAVGSDPRAYPGEHQVRAAVLALLASPSGGHWRIANGKVQKFEDGRVTRDLGAYPWGTNLLVQVTAACEEPQGNLVIGTSIGLFWYEADGKATRLTTGDGLSYNWVYSLHTDREGNVWVGTDGGGLNMVKRHPFRVLEGTESLVVQSVCEDSSGGLWLAANQGGAQCWFGGSLTNFAMSSPDWIALNLPVRTVFVDRGGRVLAGVAGDVALVSGLYEFVAGQFRRRATPSSIHQPLQAIHQDRQGVLWFGTPHGLVRWNGPEWSEFTIREGLSANSVRAIADDVEGNLWIGTQGGGLNRLRDGRIESFRKSDPGLPSDDISSLCVDSEGTIWIGTAVSGLVRLHAGKWTRYSSRDGLANDGIGYLQEDSQGFLWAGSVAGLMRMRKAELNEFAAGRITQISCRVFRTGDGLPTSECTEGSQPAACQTRKGLLLFPTIQGLVSVDPRQIKVNSQPPPVVIESVFVDGKHQGSEALGAPPLRRIEVPPGREQIEIHYAGLNLGSADRTRFRYRLEPHEAGWNEDVRNVRLARYPKLPANEYRFRVIACNEDGVWNEEGSTLLVEVLPPFWQTWWFLTVSSALMLGMVVGIVRTVSTRKLQRRVERMEQQETLEKERKRIARDLHDQLGASLTQVALLGELVESDKDDPSEIENHGRQISQTARETTRVLDEIVWAVNPSNDTLEGLINYVCKHAQDYFVIAGVRYRLEVPTQLPSVEIPPEVRHNVFLAAKEAITNVVRHAKAEAAWVRLSLDAHQFQLEIEDNGRGLSGGEEQKGRNGLRNMRKRMEDVGGEFLLTPGATGGARVRLIVPLRKN
jgi:signal transduction histidine kinase/ligand-binding sensor domain-containing protein